MMRRCWAVVGMLAAGGCAGDDGGADGGTPTSVTAATAPTSDTGPAMTGTTEAAGDSDSDEGVADTTGAATDGQDTTGAPGDCTFCNDPNQMCVDDVCVTTCQGVTPDPCGPDQVCDSISGECRDAAAACTLTGDFVACGAQQCGPGTVCDDMGTCIPYSPCADVACLDDGNCWGTFCSCERAIDCQPADDATINGSFSVEISDLEFADDCTAWMVTLRSGTDFVRSLSPAGVVTEYDGVANLNMGEIAILRALTPPPGAAVRTPLTPTTPPPAAVEGIGEVAITYVCCPTCGCAADPPQGVARLDDSGVPEPLPLVIVAVPTAGTGPFGAVVTDGGPFGLTWGVDRVLYIGNSTANGDLHTADLEMATQSQIHSFAARVTASAPLTAAHIAVATIGGQLDRYNVETGVATPIADVGDDVTSMAFDAFAGLLYVSLRSLEIVSVHPFTGEVLPFQTMPVRGRVAVSPNGRLYFSPIEILDGGAVSSWDIPDAF